MKFRRYMCYRFSRLRVNQELTSSNVFVTAFSPITLATKQVKH